SPSAACTTISAISLRLRRTVTESAAVRLLPWDAMRRSTSARSSDSVRARAIAAKASSGDDWPGASLIMSEARADGPVPPAPGGWVRGVVPVCDGTVLPLGSVEAADSARPDRAGRARRPPRCRAASYVLGFRLSRSYGHGRSGLARVGARAHDRALAGAIHGASGPRRTI